MHTEKHNIVLNEWNATKYSQTKSIKQPHELEILLIRLTTDKNLPQNEESRTTQTAQQRLSTLTSKHLRGSIPGPNQTIC